MASISSQSPEIIRLPNITSVPSKCDPSVLGTFNLRGKVLPIAAWPHGWAAK